MKDLDALNIALDAIGVYPVSSYYSPHPDAVRARTLIDRLNTQIQERGWWFNKEYNFMLQPNVDDEIEVPDSTLFVDPVRTDNPVVKRGKRMYDPVLHTYKIAKEVEVNLITELEFNDLPESVQDYIAKSAAVMLATTREGDTNKITILNKELLQAKSNAFADELKNADYNMFKSGLVNRLILRTTGRRW